MTPHDLLTRRLRTGCSREQLAHSVGVPVSTLRSWEDGTAPITCPRALEQVLRQREQERGPIEALPRAS